MSARGLKAWGSRLGAFVLIVCAGETLAAQDRLILLDTWRDYGQTRLPTVIKEIEITDGGRGWSVIRSVELPRHGAITPVALADGSRVVWLTWIAGSAVLVQYEVATGRASVVDVGTFDRSAFLVADRSAVRVVVVEPTRITFIDSSLRPESIALSSAKSIREGYAAGGHLILHRSTDRADDAELVFIDIERRQIARTLFVGQAQRILVSQSGQRIYRVRYSALVRTLDRISPITGEVLATATDVDYAYLLQLDESHGFVIQDRSRSPQQLILARDPDTLAIVGELAPGVFDLRREFALWQTASEKAILVFSRQSTSYFTQCADQSPRIDVFDGTTFQPVNRIDLGGRCPAIIPLPPR